jgi:hypothetical protein
VVAIIFCDVTPCGPVEVHSCFEGMSVDLFLSARRFIPAGTTFNTCIPCFCRNINPNMSKSHTVVTDAKENG